MRPIRIVSSKNRMPAPLHVAEQHVEPGQARLDVAQHLVVRQRELAVDALDGLDVLRQQLQPLERDVLVPGREPEPDVERVEELEPDPLLLVERPHEVGVHVVEPAGAPRLGRAVRPGRQRLAGGDREEAGRLAQERLGVLAHEAEHLLPVLRAGQDVDLVHHEHDLLAPLADLLEEAALALGERPVGAGDEEHEVGAGDEVAGELLVPPDDRVGARRVHDA